MKARYLIPFLLILLLVACSPARSISPMVVEKVVEAPAATAAMAVAPQKEGAAADESLKGELALLSFSSAAGRMIIKNADLRLLVDDTDRVIDQITQLAYDSGGYLISSESSYQGEAKFATLKLGVPSAVFETTLNSLRRLGVKVLDENISGQDVSAEYNDLQSELTNLEATAARVRSFLDNAKTVEESLRIHATLSDLEGKIEKVKGQMRFYEGRSAYSTITVNLEPQTPTPTPTPTETPTPTPTPTPRWNPGKTFTSASKVMVKTVQGTADGLIFVITLFGPFVVVIGLVIWLVIWVRRKVKRSPTKP